LQLPRELLRRAHRYLRRRAKRGAGLDQLQRRREEAEKARAEALQAQHEAHKQREEYEARKAALEREAVEAETLRLARLRLQANDAVRVPKFDKVGRVVRVDAKRNLAVVSLGLGQWEVPLDEVFPLDETSSG